MSAEQWQPTFDGFEGMFVDTVEATVGATNIRLSKDMKMFDRVQVVVDCLVTGVDYDANKDKTQMFGFAEVGRRKLTLTPIDARIVRDENVVEFGADGQVD